MYAPTVQQLQNYKYQCQPTRVYSTMKNNYAYNIRTPTNSVCSYSKNNQVSTNINSNIKNNKISDNINTNIIVPKVIDNDYKLIQTSIS